MRFWLAAAASEKQHWHGGSLALIRVLRIQYFDVSEGKEATAAVHLTFPLTTNVHPGYLHDVTHLQEPDQMSHVKEYLFISILMTYFTHFGTDLNN